MQNKEMEKYRRFLANEKKMSHNSIEAYMRDIKIYETYCTKENINIADVTKADVAAYFQTLRESGATTTTVNRKISSIRVYYRYLIETEYRDDDPTSEIKMPRMLKRDIEYLTIEEVELLLEAPDESPRGQRDKAILELMYATGMKVNELVESNLEDVNLRIGFFKCSGKAGKARIVPIGMIARKMLENYINGAREKYLRNSKEGENALFINYRGTRLTRQGLWKILKTYGEEVGLGDRITPHILRTSFAVHLVQNGADLKSLQELLGHEDIAATQIYLQMTKNRIKDVYDRTHPRA